MSKSFFIDTTRCTACRGCQVACKQWHDLPAETTENQGSYQNPADVSFYTYKLVRMREELVNGKLNWFFFPDQCRHCIEAPCLEVAEDETAIFRDEATGAVIYTANTRHLNTDDIIQSCPYNIPRKGPQGALAKCDMCLDRIQNGLLPACVKTCPTGSMNFGDRDEMLKLGKQRLAEVKGKFPDAVLVDPDDVNVIYLTGHNPLLYHQYAVAPDSAFGVTRQAALRRLFRPIKNAASRMV